MEIKTEAKTYAIDMRCERCNVGDMISNGLAFTSDPPKYPHKCNKCGEMQTFSKTYPRFEARKWHEWEGDGGDVAQKPVEVRRVKKGKT